VVEVAWWRKNREYVTSPEPGSTVGLYGMSA
jgi:hypothetical protein